VSSILADSLSSCPVVQLLTVNIRNIGRLCEHRDTGAFFFHTGQCFAPESRFFSLTIWHPKHC